MNRLAIAAGLVLLAGGLFAQDSVYYNTTPQVFWTPASALPDGSPFLAGDTVEYRIYKWDVNAFGFDPPPPQANMVLIDTWVDTDPTTADANGEESRTITLSPRLEYGVALYATHIDGGGTRTDYTVFLASSRVGDVAFVPFAYIPLPSAGGEPPGQGLRDSGT